MPQIYYVAETGKWQAFGSGCIGLGDTPNEALAAWMVDYRRVNPQAPVALNRRRE